MTKKISRKPSKNLLASTSIGMVASPALEAVGLALGLHPGTGAALGAFVGGIAHYLQGRGRAGQ
jgi:hypothetical protein